MAWLRREDSDPALLAHLRQALTIQPRKLGDYDIDAVKEPILCYVETAAEFGVPRSFWFQNSKQPHEYQWDVSEGSPLRETECLLRQDGPYAEQRDIIDYFASKFGNAGTGFPTDEERGLDLGGIFQADTGFGKTDTAVGLIKELGLTTLIIVHKEFLQAQWVRRIQKWLPGLRVGIVREKTCQFEGYDIAVAMAQSLALDDGSGRYPADLYTWPGLLIVDECHRVSAPTWAPLPPRFRSAYRLGLTATPRRKDGADDVFWWHIGPIRYRAKTEMPKPRVRMISLPGKGLPDVVRDHNTKSATVVTVLGRSKTRNWRIVQEMVKALKAPSGRKLMVLSERLDHLKELDRALKKAWSDEEGEGRVPPFGFEPSVGFYVGEWFTGEEVKSLKPSQWNMANGGRAEAIDIIYRSISRRSGYHGEIDDLLAGKSHLVYVTPEDAKGIFGVNVEDTHVIRLENLEDSQLFDVARWFKIQQKPKPKMRPRTDAELAEAESARVIFATYQMCSEGVDLPAVDTIILATPVSDVEQAIGRGRRICLPSPEKCKHWCPWRALYCHGKPEPIVTDFVDSGVPLASKRSGWRRDFYASLGCVIAGP
jgi:hypothetical protein